MNLLITIVKLNNHLIKCSIKQQKKIYSVQDQILKNNIGIWVLESDFTEVYYLVHKIHLFKVNLKKGLMWKCQNHVIYRNSWPGKLSVEWKSGKNKEESYIVGESHIAESVGCQGELFEGFQNRFHKTRNARSQSGLDRQSATLANDD